MNSRDGCLWRSLSAVHHHNYLPPSPDLSTWSHHSWPEAGTGSSGFTFLCVEARGAASVSHAFTSWAKRSPQRARTPQTGQNAELEPLPRPVTAGTGPPGRPSGSASRAGPRTAPKRLTAALRRHGPRPPSGRTDWPAGRRRRPMATGSGGGRANGGRRGAGAGAGAAGARLNGEYKEARAGAGRCRACQRRAVQCCPQPRAPLRSARLRGAAFLLFFPSSPLASPVLQCSWKRRFHRPQTHSGGAAAAVCMSGAAAARRAVSPGLRRRWEARREPGPPRAAPPPRPGPPLQGMLPPPPAAAALRA